MEFEELLYADDTLIISSDAKKANKILAAIVKHSERYGLKLNEGKCEVIAPHAKANEKIAFPTGEELKKVESATYLGGQLRKDGAAKPEVEGRLAKAAAIFRKLRVSSRTQAVVAVARAGVALGPLSRRH